MPIQKFTVSRDESIYEAWPDIVRTDSGKLICVFSECEHHVDRENARIVMCESHDRGRTWSAKRALTPKGKKDDFFNCARISKLNDGRLAIICDKVTGDENSGAEIYVWFGDSEGITWSEPVKYPFCGIVPDKLLQLKCGRLIIAAHFKNKESGMLEQYMWYSDDEGKTWSDRVTIGADLRYNLCEISILECENNTLIAFMRENSFKGYDIMKAVSNDNGETWHGVYNTQMVAGHRTVSGFLNDGSVLVTYRFIPGTWHGFRNMFAAVLNKAELENTDRNDQKAIVMPVDYDRNPLPDTGYTGWTQFDDGEIYMVNYIKDDADKAYIRGYSFYPKDIVLP